MQNSCYLCVFSQNNKGIKLYSIILHLYVRVFANEYLWESSYNGSLDVIHSAER